MITPLSLLKQYVAQDKLRRAANPESRILTREQGRISEELQEMGFYIISNRDDPTQPVFNLQPIGRPSSEVIYEER